MTNKADATKTQKEILARFAGELCESGADGIVVIFSTTLRGKTRSHVAQFGNELLCSTLISHAFQTETIVYTDTEIEEDEDQ